MRREGRVLVVDDEHALRSIMVEVLAAEGYTVSAAPDGRRALEILEHEPVDVVVLDMMMPRLGGWGLIDQLNRVPGARPAIICVSAVMDRQLTEQLRHLGVSRCLTKPFDMDVLLESVDRLLNHSGVAHRFERQEHVHARQPHEAMAAD